MMSGSGGNANHDTAGSIRAAGGGFAKMEIAHEEEYFYKLVSCCCCNYCDSKFNTDKFSYYIFSVKNNFTN